MKLEVDKNLCIGCGSCQAICPEVFEIEDDGLAHSKVEEVPSEVEEDAIDATKIEMQNADEVLQKLKK